METLSLADKEQIIDIILGEVTDYNHNEIFHKIEKLDMRMLRICLNFITGSTGYPLWIAKRNCVITISRLRTKK